MPECYTHVHTATQALMRSGHTVASQPAFIAGACGPDPLYMAGVFKKAAPSPDLPQLGQRMHRERTGAFLQALVRYASTPAQQSYTLGFITHYTTDCTLSPFIAAMSTPEGPYPMEYGRFILATAIDSHLYYQNYKTRMVALHAATPVLITDDLAQVCTLLQEAIREVYQLEVPLIALADMFHDNLAARRLMLAKRAPKRTLVKLVEPKRLFDTAGPLHLRTQPGPPLRHLPDVWIHPYTGDEMKLPLDEVLALAEQTGAVCVTAVMRTWLGSLGEDKLAEVLGNNDYHTGLPCGTAPAQGIAPPRPDDDAAADAPAQSPEAAPPAPEVAAAPQPVAGQTG